MTTRTISNILTPTKVLSTASDEQMVNNKLELEKAACRFHSFFNYTDYSVYPIYNEHSDSEAESKDRGANHSQFPDKLFKMLEDVIEEGREDIVSWQPHGRSFLVHKTEEFVENIMPRYFKQSRYASFQRQLSMYGFARLTQGRDTGAYYHELFLMGRPDLLKKLMRVRSTRGMGYKMPSDRHSQPDFYLMKSVGAPPKSKNSSIQTLQQILDGVPPMDSIDNATVISDDEDTACRNLKKKNPQGEPALCPLRIPGRLRNVFTRQGHQAPAPSTSMIIDGLKHPPTSSWYGPSLDQPTASTAHEMSSLVVSEKVDSEYEYKIFHENLPEVLSSFLSEGTHNHVATSSTEEGADTMLKHTQGQVDSSFDDPIFWL